MAGIGGGSDQGKAGLLFVNKKKQKNFVHLGRALATGTQLMDESFLVIFSKKEHPCFAPAP